MQARRDLEFPAVLDGVHTPHPVGGVLLVNACLPFMFYTNIYGCIESIFLHLLLPGPGAAPIFLPRVLLACSGGLALQLAGRVIVAYPQSPIQLPVLAAFAWKS